MKVSKFKSVGWRRILKKTFLGVLFAILFSVFLIVGINLNMAKGTEYDSLGTSVGGIIWENTTWTLENSPYIITDTVQIPENVTLTIEPGVTVISSLDDYDEMFLLHGTIHAHGSIDKKITFNGGGNSVFFNAQNSKADTFLDLDYCIIQDGVRFWHSGGGAVSAHFSLKHSELTNLFAVSGSFVNYPGKDVYIEYNKFVNSNGFTFELYGYYDAKVYIRNNLFKENNGPVIRTYNSHTPIMIVENNSFIDMNGIVLELAGGTSVFSATKNYWGTTDTEVIDSMIFDRKDDIRCAGFIEYLPILSEPHPDTPKISSTIYVDDDNTTGPWDGTPEHPYQNITQGLSHALKNDTIFVYNGTYYENILVNKTLSLVGEDKDTTIIDGDRTDNVVHVTSDNNNISGFTVQNSGPYPGSGFYIDHSSGNNISHNIIKNNNYGIWLYYSENNTVSSNNVLNNNVYGIYIHSIYGVSGDNIVVGNTASNNEIGIKVFHSDNNVLIDNKFSTNSYGIYCFSGNSNVVVGNTVSSNSIGICLSNSDGNTLSGGIASNNYIGMWLCSSRNNTICDNSIFSNNHDGIQLKDYSDRNTLTNNNVSNNDHGIYLDNSVDSILFHNNFINNIQQVSSTDSQNIWDDGYPSGGNYWSDYEGNDTYSGPFQNEIGSDGIGDLPYTVDESNQDRYPLMKPWAPLPVKVFDVVWEEVNYPVAIFSNSTVSHFIFNQTLAQVKFNVSGTSGTVGFCNITIPENLLWGSFMVYLDGDPLVEDVDYTQTYNGTHYLFHLRYEHSSHEIRITGEHAIPEFPSLIILLLFMVATLITTVISKRKKSICGPERKIT